MAARDLAVPATFFERARREAERYGDDPWIFVRELVQNSRDAGATHIRFGAVTDGTVEQLTCEDDGAGMSRADVGRYLLRLYASRKARETAPSGELPEDAVGKFGVGFWSVLRFGPALIRVESRSAATGDAIRIDVDCIAQTISEHPSDRTAPGTRVTLVRPIRAAAEEASRFRADVANRLRRYAGCVRGVSGGPAPKLLLDGRPLNRQLLPRGYIGERVRGRGFDGVVGLAERPCVRLYAHGLLVKEVTSLEELLPRRGDSAKLSAPGLHPRAEINADGLEVLLDRQAVVEDELLESIVSTCERQLSRLRRNLVDRLAPLPLLRRALLLFEDRVRLALVASGAVVLLASAGLTALLVGALDDSLGPASRRPSASAATGSRRIEDALDLREGPVINTPESSRGDARPWDLRYEGAGSPFIKTATFITYDRDRGLLAEPLRTTGGYRLQAADRDPRALTLELGVRTGRGPILLPVPAGHRVIADSVRLDDTDVGALLRTSFDEPVVQRRRPSGGRLRYQTAPASWSPSPSQAAMLPPPGLPDELREVSLAAAELPTATATAREIARWVRGRLRYTTDAIDAGVFQRSSRPWVERVLAFNAGDCDVMNGLAVLMLRTAGIPARLGVGFVGEGGRVATDLHAWTEFWDGDRWRAIDASPPVFRPRPSLSSTAALAGAERSAAARGARPPMPRGPSSTAPATGLAGAAGEAGRDVDGTAIDGTAIDGTAIDGAAIDDDSGAPRLLPATREPVAPGSPEGSSVRAAVRVGSGIAFAGALAGLVWLLLVAWRRRDRGAHEDDEKVALALLKSFLDEGGGQDPLQLRHRPFFRTLAGRRLSLAEIDTLAHDGRLFVACEKNTLVPALRASTPVLDARDPRVVTFRSRLPAHIDLDTLSRRLRSASPRPPAFDRIEALLRSIDPHVRLTVDEQSDTTEELQLPIVHARAPVGVEPRHIVVGLRDPEIAAALDGDEGDALRRFRLLQRILLSTTLYLDHRAALLGVAARAVIDGEAS